MSISGSLGMSISNISKGALIMNDSDRIKILQSVLARDLTLAKRQKS